MKSTKDVDELKEIKNNNLAVSLLSSAVMLSICIYIKPSLAIFISGLINYSLLEINIPQ